MTRGMDLKQMPARVRRQGRGALQRAGVGRFLAATLLAAMVVMRVIDPAPIGALRLRTFDFFQSMRPRESTVHPVVIADIDERSIAALGQWPWPRTRMAELVDRVRASGALAVGFDIVFAEPDRLSPSHLADDVPGLDPQTRARLAALPGNDDVFAASLRKIRSVVGETALDEARADPPDAPRAGFATIGPAAGPFVRRFPGLLRNVDALERAATGRGLFTIAPESDGIVRRVPMVLQVGAHLVPSLSLEILRVLTGSGTILARADRNGLRSIVLPGFELPTDPHGEVWVAFGAHDPARFVSAADILSGSAPRSRLAGKIVLVGTSAVGLLDNKTTPVTRSMPGVEIHAQVLEGALSGALLHRPRDALALELVMTLLVAAGVIVVAPSLGPLPLLALGGLVAGGIAAGSWWVYISAIPATRWPRSPSSRAASRCIAVKRVIWMRC